MSRRLNTAGGCAALIAFPIGAVYGLVKEVCNYNERKRLREEQEQFEREQIRLEQEQQKREAAERDALISGKNELAIIELMQNDKKRATELDFNDTELIRGVIDAFTMYAKDLFTSAAGDIIVSDITREPDLTAIFCICNNDKISKNYKRKIYNDRYGYYFKLDNKRWYFHKELPEFIITDDFDAPCLR